MGKKEALAELTDAEKIALVSGRDFFSTNSVPRLGINRITMADGPHGLRKQLGSADNGVSLSEPSVAFPTAATTASSFNPENLYLMGRAMAEEALHYGVNVILGPGVNIKRNPLCGRNFEYFSEDPYLSGKMGCAEVKGIQSLGVSACVKHFALNNNEECRFMGDSVADMRTMREIYLRPFEMTVKEASPDCVMTAYNKIRGTYCSENSWLIQDLLRGEWGFSGLTMTDWGGIHDRKKALLAGLDLEMPGDYTYARWQLHSGINENGVKAALNDSVGRILALEEKHAEKKKFIADFEAHDKLSAKIAEDSAILLKNDGALPLCENDKISVVGNLFERMRYQGSGSSMINSTKVTSPKDAFDEAGIEYKYEKGYLENEETKRDELIMRAVEICRDCDKILLFIGLTDNSESEGGDRRSMRLPENQIRLCEAICALGKPTVAVLFGGSPFEIPFIDKINAILNMYLPGQAGGIATRNLLFGYVNPSGRLAESWPKSYGGVLFGENYAKKTTEVYKEGLFVGYRYYIDKPELVQFPFGYGLSYSEVKYGNMELSLNNGELECRAEITNLSDLPTKEVVQLYIRPPKTEVYKPSYELRGFEKVSLMPRETKLVKICVDTKDLAYFDESSSKKILEGGSYEIMLAKSSRDIVITKAIELESDSDVLPYLSEVCELYNGRRFYEIDDEAFFAHAGLKIAEEPPLLPITMDSKFSSLKSTAFGKIIRRGVLYFLSDRLLKKAKKFPPSIERDNAIKGAIFMKKMLDTNTLNSMVACSSGRVSYNTALGIMHIANGQIFKGLSCIFKRIKVPRLPEEE